MTPGDIFSLVANVVLIILVAILIWKAGNNVK